MFWVLTCSYTPCCQKVPSFLCTWPPLFGDFWQFWKGVSDPKGDFRVSKKHSFLAFHKNAKTDYGRKRRLDDKKVPLFWSKMTLFLTLFLGWFLAVFGLLGSPDARCKTAQTPKNHCFWNDFEQKGSKMTWQQTNKKQTQNHKTGLFLGRFLRSNWSFLEWSSVCTCPF